MKYGLKLSNPKAFFDGECSQPAAVLESLWHIVSCRARALSRATWARLPAQLATSYHHRQLMNAWLCCPPAAEAHRATHFLDFAGIEEGQGTLVDGVEDHFA